MRSLMFTLSPSIFQTFACFVIGPPFARCAIRLFCLQTKQIDSVNKQMKRGHIRGEHREAEKRYYEEEREKERLQIAN